MNCSKLDKGEIGEKLGLINEQIRIKSSRINQSVSIPILLCLEEVVEDCQLDVYRQYHVERNMNIDRETNFIVNVSLIARLYQEINDAIVSILKNGFVSAFKGSSSPELLFGVYGRQNFDDYLRELMTQGKIEPVEPRKDIVCHTEISSEEFSGGFMIILKHGSKRDKDSFKKILELREMHYQKALLEQLLRLPSGAIKKPEDNDIDSAIRFFEVNASVPDWNSNLRALTLQTLKLTPIKGDKNLAQMKKEQNATFQSYERLENFPQTFKQEFGISYLAFFRIASKMIDICYKNRSNLGICHWSELPRILRRETKFSISEIKTVIKLLSENPSLKHISSNAIIVGDRILFNLHRLNLAILALSEGLYEEIYSNDLKGISFENACRKLVSSKGFLTVPRRVDVFESMIPTNISLLLWGKQKNRSDIDVLACFNNIIIVVECKKTKSKISKEKMKQLTRSAIEHYYKTRWISENIVRLEKYIGGNLSDILSIDKRKRIFLIPLMVTSKPLDIKESKIQPISYLELQAIDLKKEFEMNWSGQSEGLIELQHSSRRFQIPWFSTALDSL